MLMRITLIVALLLSSSGCVYFNTFYAARKNFNSAESSRRKAARDKASGQEISQYQTALKKASKVLSEHPNSSWIDDALFVIGKSFYYLGDYSKAERKFRELLSSFPDSKYADESRLMLGKSRYQLDNYLLAKEVFRDYIENSKKSEWRAEATYLMAEISTKEKDTTAALSYYQKFVEQNRSDPRAADVWMKIGLLQYHKQTPADAIVSFQQATKLHKDPKLQLDARYQTGRALYAVDSIEQGLLLFDKLRKEQKDSVKLGEILLRVAEGLDLKGEEREAILLYDEIATNFKNRIESAEAYYRLGEIAQNQWEDFVVAKEMFELASREQRGGDWRAKALEKVSDIRKLETYRTALAGDSVSTEAAAENRYLLAEMYRSDLDRPDSAVVQYLKIIADYPETELAPRSLLALGSLKEDHYGDSAAARQLYQKIVEEYPQSDVFRRALDLLDLEGAEPYQFYPDKLYALAEEQFFDSANLDSARTLFDRLVRDFPQSRLVPRAEFAIAKIDLQQFEPQHRRKQPVSGVKDSAALLLDSTSSITAPPPVDSVRSDSPDSLQATKPKKEIDLAPIRKATGQDSTRPAAIENPKLKEEASKNNGFASQAFDSATMFNADSLIRPWDMTRDRPPKSDSATARTDSLRNGQKTPVQSRLESFLDSSRTTRADSLARAAKEERRPGVKADTTKPGTNPIQATTPTAPRPQAPNPADTIEIDSTMIKRFQALAAKYIGTPIGDEAARLAQGALRVAPQRQQPPTEQQQQQAKPTAQDSIIAKDTTVFNPADTLTAAQREEQRLKEEIDTWPLLEDKPEQTGEFVYPVEAAISKFEGRVVLKIKLDFEGRVNEVIFLKGSRIDVIDQQVEKAMRDTYFSTIKIDPLKLRAGYFIYNYEIILPEAYR